MTEDKLLELVTDIAPKHEFVDPETGIKDFSVLGFSREFAAAIEQAARREALNESALNEVDHTTSSREACDGIRALMGEEGK